MSEKKEEHEEHEEEWLCSPLRGNRGQKGWVAWACRVMSPYRAHVLTLSLSHFPDLLPAAILLALTSPICCPLPSSMNMVEVMR